MSGGANPAPLNLGNSAPPPPLLENPAISSTTRKEEEQQQKPGAADTLPHTPCFPTPVFAREKKKNF